MGLDVLVIRGCKEQKKAGERGFLEAIKLATTIERIKTLFDEQGVAAKDQRTRGVKFPVRADAGEQVDRETTLGAIIDEDKKLRARLKECSKCSLGADGKGGCFVSVPYVEDEHLCRVLFEFFVQYVADQKTSAYALFDGVLARIDLADMESFAAPFTTQTEVASITVEEIAVTNRALLGAVLSYGQDPEARSFIAPFLGEFLVHVTIGRGIDRLASLPVDQLVAELTGRDNTDGAVTVHAPRDTWDLLTGPMSAPLLKLAVLLERVETTDQVVWDG